jgi:hypothetical protein
MKQEEVKSLAVYKFGRWVLIFLALVNTGIDFQKLKEDLERSEIYINKSKLDSIEYYSSTIVTHIIGLTAAFDHRIWLTLLCRLVSCLIYQFDLTQKVNQTLPKDPKELNKLIKNEIKKYPKMFNKKTTETNTWSESFIQGEWSFCFLI